VAKTGSVGADLNARPNVALRDGLLKQRNLETGPTQRNKRRPCLRCRRRSPEPVSRCHIRGATGLTLGQVYVAAEPIAESSAPALQRSRYEYTLEAALLPEVGGEFTHGFSPYAMPL